MKIPFSKYHGAGNDFVMIDNTSAIFSANKLPVKSICHRRFGIGADGLILLESSKEFDFKMLYFNSDGNPGTMCGNGGRSTVAFAHRLKLIGATTTFLASDGPHTASIDQDRGKIKLISLGMSPVSEIIQTDDGGFFLNTGSPHLVVFSDNIDDLDVYKEGKRLRYDKRFAPGGCNVNFVEIINQNHLYVRTYERGVEDETYACGTGITASALSFANKNHLDEGTLSMKAKGGDLKVSWKKINSIYNNIVLSGPAEWVFDGIIEIDD